jgi:peptidoglycan-associated lipoprotein
MVKKYFVTIFLVLCIGLISAGCLRRTVVRTEPSARKAEETTTEREEAARLEAERKEREAQEREAARIKEEEARIKEEEAKMPQASKEFEKSLVAQKTPGIEGEVFESKLLKDIHFDFDKYDIRPSDVEILKENAAVLNKFPKVKIQVEGHCDERGTSEYNLALGERRANNAKKYLISFGIDKNRISTISYGKEKPLDPGHNEEAWAKNRRAHFIILSK